MGNKEILSPVNICGIIIVGTVCLLALLQNVSLSSDFLAALASSALTYLIVNKATKGNIIVETLPRLLHQEPKE